MADVKWIKITTDIFDNRKIRQIETLPDGDAIIVIWMKLLCLAGNINDGGDIYFTEEVPYTDQMLATQFGRPLNTIKLALETFSRFKMIDVIDDILHISNWEKYQNIEGMEKIREQNRIRKQRQRARARIPMSDVTGQSRDSHATDIEEDKKEIRKEKDEEENIYLQESDDPAPSLKKPVRHKYGEYSNVLLTDDDLEKLKDEFIDWEQRIERLSEYMASTGKSYKSHLATIRNWARKDKAQQPKSSQKSRLSWIDDLMQKEGDIIDL